MEPHLGDVHRGAVLRGVEVLPGPVHPPVALDQVRRELEAEPEVVDRAQRPRDVESPDQVHAHPLDWQEHRQRLLADRREVVGGELHELALVVVVAFREVGEVQLQVVPDELEVLVHLEVGRTVLAQEVVHHPVHRDPVPEVLELVAPLGDRGLRLLGVRHHPPVVDDVRDHCDGLGLAVDLGREQRVLVVHALREPDLVAVQELAAVDLVGRERVEEEQRVLAHTAVDGAAGEQLLGPGQLAVIRQVDPDHLPGDDVRAGPLGRDQQVLAGMPLVDVVAVQEHDVRRPRPLDADVARQTASAAVLRQAHDADPGVLPGDLLGQLHRVVGRAVVDDQHLEVAQALAEHRPDRLRQVLAVVVPDDHDRHVRRGGWAGDGPSGHSDFLPFLVRRLPAAAAKSMAGMFQMTGGLPARVRRQTVRQRIGRRSPAPGPIPSRNPANHRRSSRTDRNLTTLSRVQAVT